MQAPWKDNWEETKDRFRDWWKGEGYIIGAWSPPRDQGIWRGAVPECPPPASLEQQWTDIGWRTRNMQRLAASMFFPLETLPVFSPDIGPGTLALYLGSKAVLQPNTVWYEAWIENPDTCGTIAFDPENSWWTFQLELIDRMMETAGGHYYIGSPDLIENWDILASLRGAEDLLLDSMERPEWVAGKIAEINQAWFEAYGVLYEKLRKQDGASMFGHFGLWAEGKVAKVQCDASAMISPTLFRRLVQPALREQCDALDYSLYHLDGSQCLDKLDALLEIDSLTAIEWTPDPKVPAAGSLHWVDLYRRILDAGKRVQVLFPAPHEIEPLVDALGAPDGLYFLMSGLDRKGWEQCEEIRRRLG